MYRQSEWYDVEGYEDVDIAAYDLQIRDNDDNTVTIIPDLYDIVEDYECLTLTGVTGFYISKERIADDLEDYIVDHFNINQPPITVRFRLRYYISNIQQRVEGDGKDYCDKETYTDYAEIDLVRIEILE